MNTIQQPAALLVASLALVVGACTGGGFDEESVVAVSSTSTLLEAGASTTTTMPSTTTTMPSTTTTKTDSTEIVVTVEAGSVAGGGRISVDQGSTVRLIVTADVTDRVHVHGYNIFGEVAPGVPAVLEFDADIPGIFEVELESSGLELINLVVSP